MTDPNITEYAYARALEAIAMGEPYEPTREAIRAACPQLTYAHVEIQLAHAYRDALRQGVEHEDIDPSWPRYI